MIGHKTSLNKYKRTDIISRIFTDHKGLKQETKDTLFSNAHGKFSKIDHMIGHKTSLNNFKKIDIISTIFSDHKGLKLETNLKEKTQEYSNSWRLNNRLLNNEWVSNEIKE